MKFGRVLGAFNVSIGVALAPAFKGKATEKVADDLDLALVELRGARLVGTQKSHDADDLKVLSSFLWPGISVRRTTFGEGAFPIPYLFIDEHLKLRQCRPGAPQAAATSGP